MFSVFRNAAMGLFRRTEFVRVFTASAVAAVVILALLGAPRAEERPSSPTSSVASGGLSESSPGSSALADLASEQSIADVPPPPQPPTGVPEDTYLDKDPPRQTVGLNLVKMGWTYDCMECHRSLDPKWHYDHPMVEHESIHLNHGNNRFCLNCHHPTNRNAFVDYDGSEIPEADVVLLCAKCHGPTYRDWRAGAHGRRNGYWNTASGPQTRLKCIQCHNPQHAPGQEPKHGVEHVAAADH